MPYAVIKNTKIGDLFFRSLEELKDKYSPEFIRSLVEVPDHALPGLYFYDGEVHLNPKPSFSVVRVRILQKIHAKKKKKKDGGFFVEGILFDSDTSANVAYLNFNSKVSLDYNFSVEKWKASEGTWVKMDAFLFMKVSAAFEENNSAAFAWQADMENVLRATPDTLEALTALEAQIDNA